MNYSRTTLTLPFCAIVGLAILSVGAGAQSTLRELVGVVRDANGRGIRDAAVEIPGIAVRTDSAGLFRLWTLNIDTVTISIRRLGYSAIEALLNARNKQWDTVMVELEDISQELPGVTVAGDRNQRALEGGLRTFGERKAQGLGLFVTRTDITDRNSLRLSDVLQTRRGVILVKIGTNRMGVRFATYSGPRGGCIPDLWLDGQRARGMEVDDVVATSVEAMELYDSFATVPSQFSHSANAVPCGTILIWTRIPGKP